MLPVKGSRKLLRQKGDCSVRLLICAGGTGGGVYPALAALKALKNRADATVAEGVETPAQLAALREVGVGACQGYLLGKPMPSDEVPGFLRGR